MAKKARSKDKGKKRSLKRFSSPSSPKLTVVPISREAAIRMRVEKRLASSRPNEGGDASELQSNASSLPPPDVARILQRLPGLEIHQLVRVWKNAIQKATEPGTSRRWKKAATEVMQAVETEWRKRGKRQALSDDYFAWPSTVADGGDRSLTFDGKSEDGLLSYLEYRVGKTNGEAAPVRRTILDRVFVGSLPPVFPKQYMDEWATPNSAVRLRKMAESLAAFTRNAKRRDPDLLDEAIRHWEDDLEYLYEKYYIGHFHFGWPKTSVI